MRRRAGLGVESTFFLKLCSNISNWDSRSCVIGPIFFELLLEVKRLSGTFVRSKTFFLVAVW